MPSLTHPERLLFATKQPLALVTEPRQSQTLSRTGTSGLRMLSKLKNHHIVQESQRTSQPRGNAVPSASTSKAMRLAHSSASHDLTQVPMTQRLTPGNTSEGSETPISKNAASVCLFLGDWCRLRGLSPRGPQEGRLLTAGGAAGSGMWPLPGGVSRLSAVCNCLFT